MVWKMEYRFKKNPKIDREGWEIEKLHNMLTEANIEHFYEERFKGAMDMGNGWDWGYQITIYDDNGNRILSAIEGAGGYGFEDNLIEIMGLLTPEEQESEAVKGWLTAEEVFKRIEGYYAML